MSFYVRSFTRKKILFLSLLIIFLGSISRPMSAEGLIHQDLHYGYSIEFPNNWYFDDTIVKFPADPGIDSGGSILGSFRDGVYLWNHFISVTLIYNDTISINYKGQQFLDRLTEELRNTCSSATFDVEGYQCSNYQIKSANKINFGGKEAYQITESWTEIYPKKPQTEKISIVTDIVVGKNVWQIDSINLVDSYKKDYKAINDTINSFEFIDARGVTLSNQGFFIPHWIKNNAKWLSDGSITYDDFVKGIQYLLSQGIIQIPHSTNNTSSQQNSQWVKNTAGLWANGQVSDDEFMKAIQYLVS